MRLQLLAVSNRQPDWVNRGFDEYAKRLRGHCSLELRQLGLARRSAASSAQRARAEEGARLLAAIPDGARVVALSEQGQQWSTAQLVARMQSWMQAGAPVCFLVGGPDGLDPACTARAHEHWALSRLTLPHGLARIAVAEALYRAWSVIQRHPYHRA